MNRIDAAGRPCALLVVLLSALARFAFAELRFRGRGGLLVIALFILIATWTNFWPSSSQPGPPRPPGGAAQLQAAYFVDFSLVLNGVVPMALPLVVLFAFAGKQLGSGIMQGAVKG